MTAFDDLPARLKNARRRERRRTREQAAANKPRSLDLREIAPDRALRLYDRPVALPGPRQPAVCPTCGRALACFDHRGQAMLLREACARLWPTSCPSGQTSLRAIVRAITPLAEIKLRHVGNEQDYMRVYYAANKERLAAKRQAWLETQPDQGRRYRRAYYRAHREEILERQLARYHANKADIQARQAEYRQKNREKERLRKRRWKAEHYEQYLAGRRAYEAANRERLLAQRRARRAADPEKDRAYHRAYNRRRKAARPEEDHS